MRCLLTKRAKPPLLVQKSRGTLCGLSDAFEEMAACRACSARGGHLAVADGIERGLHMAYRLGRLLGAIAEAAVHTEAAHAATHELGHLRRGVENLSLPHTSAAQGIGGHDARAVELVTHLELE